MLSEGLLAWARLLIVQQQPGRAVSILRFVAEDAESSPATRQQAHVLLCQQPGNPKAQQQEIPQRSDLLADILGYVPRRG